MDLIGVEVLLLDLDFLSEDRPGKRVNLGVFLAWDLVMFWVVLVLNKSTSMVLTVVGADLGSVSLYRGSLDSKSDRKLTQSILVMVSPKLFLSLIQLLKADLQGSEM